VAAEGAAPLEYDGIPFKMSDTPGSIRTPGPLLGEHTDSILRERLQMTADEIAALRAAGVVA